MTSGSGKTRSGHSIRTSRRSAVAVRRCWVLIGLACSFQAVSGLEITVLSPIDTRDDRAMDVFFADTEAAFYHNQNAIYRYDRITGESTVIDRGDRRSSILSPDFCPTTNRIVYMSGAHEYAVPIIHDTATGQRQRFPRTVSRDETSELTILELRWLDGSTFVYLGIVDYSLDGGHKEIGTVSLTDWEPHPLVADVQLSIIDFRSDLALIAYRSQDGRGDGTDDSHAILNVRTGEEMQLEDTSGSVALISNSEYINYNVRNRNSTDRSMFLVDLVGRSQERIEPLGPVGSVYSVEVVSSGDGQLVVKYLAADGPGNIAIAFAVLSE